MFIGVAKPSGSRLHFDALYAFACSRQFGDTSAAQPPPLRAFSYHSLPMGLPRSAKNAVSWPPFSACAGDAGNRIALNVQHFTGA